MLVTDQLDKTFIPQSHAPKKISHIDFTYMSATDIRKMSAAPINKPDFYDVNVTTKPNANGPLDLRLGTTNDAYPCQTCGQTSEKCPGHFGSMDLHFPVFNIGYYDHIIHILRCICKTCSRILLPDQDINTRLNRLFKSPPQTVSARLDKIKSLIKECEKVQICPHCGAINGPINIRKNKNVLLIAHMIGAKSDALAETFKELFDKVDIGEGDSKQFLQYISEDITPVKTYHLFDRIPTRELPLLMSGMKISSPKSMIISSIIVPPVCIRPSVISSGEGSNEDDLTIRIREAIDNNNQIFKTIDTGEPASTFAEKWNICQQNMNSFINSEGKDTLLKTKKNKNKAVIGIAQRLKGKHGRFRTNLSGKRVNFSGRTVISPDPNAMIDQVVVPLEMAMVATFPTRVTQYNIDLLRKLVANGPSVYPGANRIISAKDGLKKDLRYIAKRQDIAHSLRYGDIVERHLLDDDTVLFNRQPSLHRISIMAFRAKVMPWRTLRFNECACAPFNADFDGDEMNIHLPQTVEAASDAKILMNVLSNLFSPRAGELIVAPTQDFLSGTYLLTRKNVFLDYDHFTFLLTQIFDASVKIDLPMPAILAPIPLWTGKQVISMMLKPNGDSPFHFNHSIKNKEYKGDLHMDVNDGYVSFMDSYMISGVLEKSLIGGGSKSIFATIARDVSPQFSAIIMGRISKVSVRYLMNRGFSIGITDVTPDHTLISEKGRIIKDALIKTDEAIENLKNGKFPANPGMTATDSLEIFINSTLSQVRTDIGKICLHQLSNLNTALVMAKSGAKGSDINISQMTACVGQQVISGRRVIDDFIDRTIPHFHHSSLEPKAKGFVANSFYSGLSPYEFFFHTIGGREGLVDAAVKTAETGYLQRRLMKALEDAIVAYDGTVRIADGTIVQFVYGDDGFDPLCMEQPKSPVDMVRISDDLMFKNQEGEIITPLRCIQQAKAHLQKYRREYNDNSFEVPSFYIDQIETFIKNDIAQKNAEFLNTFKPMLLAHVSGLDARDIEELFARESAIREEESFLKTEIAKLNEDDSRILKDKKHRLSRRNKEILLKNKLLRDEKEKQLSEIWVSINEDFHSQIIKIFEKSCRNQFPLTVSFIHEFIEYVIMRAEKARIEPGTAVGAIAGQSIGEPATQMTLKSFHFAGVASMNVTLGVPRIQEVMNAVTNIKTPVITAYLNNDESPIAARTMKAQIDRVLLGQVAETIQEIQCEEGCYIDITLDVKLLDEAKLTKVITPEIVRRSILETKKIGIKPEHVNIRGSNAVQISFQDLPQDSLAFVMQQLMLKLPDIPVSGIKGVNRVLINQKDNKHTLLVEGNALLNVMTTYGINGNKTSSNHISDVEKVLGLEAARSVIISEIESVYQNYSLSIDHRHLMLLADIMTMRGKINGITRFGLEKSSTSSLKLASFETTMTHLFNAGFHQIEDDTKSITSCVILGRFAPIGSGMVDILVNNDIITKPILTPRNFLTPQPESKLRVAIENGSFVLPK